MYPQRYAVLLCALITVCFSTSAFAACTGTPGFRDTFQTMQPSWGSPQDPEKSVQNGAMLVKPPPGEWYVDLNQSNFYGDGSLCVTATITAASDPNGATAMVVFWATDPNNFYVFQYQTINNNQGTFSVYKLTDGKWLNPVAWTSASDVKAGLGSANAIEIDMKGNTAAIIVNGYQLTQFTGSPPKGGGLIGLGGETTAGVTATIAYQNFAFYPAP